MIKNTSMKLCTISTEKIQIQKMKEPKNIKFQIMNNWILFHVK